MDYINKFTTYINSIFLPVVNENENKLSDIDKNNLQDISTLIGSNTVYEGDLVIENDLFIICYGPLPTFIVEGSSMCMNTLEL